MPIFSMSATGRQNIQMVMNKMKWNNKGVSHKGRIWVLAYSIVLVLVSCDGYGQMDEKAQVPRQNAAVFDKLNKGLNMDTSTPRRGVWPKIQHDESHFEAAADAGFQSVRVFLPFAADREGTEQQIREALKYDLAIVICMWGSRDWVNNPEQGAREIAQKWGTLARAWKNYPEDVVFEILNEPEGIQFKSASDAAAVMKLYNAAVQAIRDVDEDRPILIGSPGYNDSEVLDPYVTDEYLTYEFGGGTGFYEDGNTGVAIHFYAPKHKDGLNFAMWTTPLGSDEARWKTPITNEINHAVEWREKIDANIPIVTTEWGCWLFPDRSEADLEAWLNHHMNLFTTHKIGQMWYTGFQNNQRSFGVFDSEFGWNTTVLSSITGQLPSKNIPVSQVINGEFFKPDLAWKVSNPLLVKDFVFGQAAYSGTSMLKLDIPANDGGQLFLQTYSGENGYIGAPGRSLIHLVTGQTYRLRFIGGSESGKALTRLVLRDVASMKELYSSTEDLGTLITLPIGGQQFEFLYTHNSETVMDARLEFDFQGGEQTVFLDQVDLIRQ